MKKLKPNKIYVTVEKIFYYTDNNGTLKGSYLTRIGAQMGLEDYLNSVKEKESEISNESPPV
jgi:hypothetical protein